MAVVGMGCLRQSAPDLQCLECETRDRLVCRFEWCGLLRFPLIVLPFFVSVIAGAIRGGYWGIVVFRAWR